MRGEPHSGLVRRNKEVRHTAVTRSNQSCPQAEQVSTTSLAPVGTIVLDVRSGQHREAVARTTV